MSTDNQEPVTTKVHEKVITELSAFINGTDFKNVEKANRKLAEQIKNITASDLDFGEIMTAKFFRGYFEGNVRSEGRKTSGDYTSTRTLNFDFTTKTIGFVDDGTTADDNALYYAAQLMGMHMYDLGVAQFSHFEQLGKEIYKKDQSNFAIIRNVFPVCEYEHEKLGYYLDADSIKILQAQFFREQEAEISLSPIYANSVDKKGRPVKIFLGYIAEGGTIIIDSETIIGNPKSRIFGVPEKKVSIGKIIKWVVIGAIALDIIGLIISFLIR